MEPGHDHIPFLVTKGYETEFCLHVVNTLHYDEDKL